VANNGTEIHSSQRHLVTAFWNKFDAVQTHPYLMSSLECDVAIREPIVLAVVEFMAGCIWVDWQLVAWCSRASIRDQKVHLCIGGGSGHWAALLSADE
jgi:hypothetical protein